MRDTDGGDFADARNKALRLLSYGSRSKAALYERLRDAGFDRDAADYAVGEMEELGFINDGKLAADYVSLAAESKGFGERRIIGELMRKGVDKRLAEQAYAAYVAGRREQERDCDGEAEIDPDLENAAAALSRRMRQTGLRPDTLDGGDRRRLTGFLYRRGFSFDVIDKAFRVVSEEEY